MNGQRGVSLIEVLIAVLILSVGLLGIAGLQSAALTGNLTSYQYLQASVLAQSMVERMRANRSAVLAGLYQMTAGTAPSVGTDCSANTCTTAAQANWDMGLLYSEATGTAITNVPQLTPNDGAATPNNIGSLPGGNASISCPTPFPNDSVGSCLITVYWDIDRTAPSTYSCSATSGGCFQLAFQP